MALTKADLLNKALLKIRQAPYSSFEERAAQNADDNDEAPSMVHICNQIYPSSRDELLCMYHWEFAANVQIAVKDGTYNASAPDDYNVLFKYRYNLPEDMVFGSGIQLFLQNMIPVKSFLLNKGKLLANNDNICIQYIRVIPDTEKRPPLFDDLHVSYLAKKLAANVNVSSNDAQLLEMDFENAFALAKLTDAKNSCCGQIITFTG